MVSLSRFTDLHDRFQTQIFTFIVPKTILSDYHSEVHSKDFFYAYQRWYLVFTKTEHHLCASLHLRTTTSPNVMTVHLDLTLILHNREHFSRNELFSLKNCAFTVECPVQVCPNFVGLDDLLHRQFTDEQSEFIVDVVLKNPRSVYEDSIQMPVRVKGRPWMERLESSYFAFGNLEWNLVLFPTPGATLLKLNRMTHFEHNCRAKFRVHIGSANNGRSPFVSPILESSSDLSGTGESSTLNCALEELVDQNCLKIRLEMFSANLISEISVAGLSQMVPFYDRDKQAWNLQLTTQQKGDQEFVKVKFFYADVKNIPREHARYCAWKVHVLPANSSSNQTKFDILGPFCKYYQQRDVDISFEIVTKTPLNRAGKVANQVEEEDSFVILVEWIHLHLLLPSHFHHYDDIHRQQYHQMRLEFATVQTECYALERTLLQYQHGIQPDRIPPDKNKFVNAEQVNGIAE